MALFQPLRLNQFFGKKNKTISQFSSEIQTSISDIVAYCQTLPIRLDHFVKQKKEILQSDLQASDVLQQKFITNCQETILLKKKGLLKATTAIKILSEFIHQELAKTQLKNDKCPYEQNLLKLIHYLHNYENNFHGLYQIFINLESCSQRLDELFVLSKKGKNIFAQLCQEFMRVGHYFHIEYTLIGATKIDELRTFIQAYENLIDLGLVYSETKIDNDTIPFLASKLINESKQTGKELYGLKGIVYAHEKDSLQVAFITSRNARHAQLVQMMLKGLPLGKLKNEEQVRTYLHSLNDETITHIAGYELLFEIEQTKNEKNEIIKKYHILQIAFASTILKVLSEKNELRVVSIEKKLLERMHYALLLSIDPLFKTSNEIASHIEKKGHKICFMCPDIDKLTI